MQRQPQQYTALFAAWRMHVWFAPALTFAMAAPRPVYLPQAQ